MGNIGIDDGVHERFRRAVGRLYGYKHGNLKKYAEEAIRDWIDKKGEVKSESMSLERIN